MKLFRWVQAIVTECIAFLLVLVTIPLGWMGFYKKPAGNLKGRPILLVPGYVNNSSVWFFVRWRLKKAGLGPIYSINMGNPFRSIHHYAQMVNEKAKEIQRETQRDDLILIGHSMGGLVAFLYATHYAPASKVTDLIAIASPFKGTFSAYIAPGANGREMRTNSPFSQKLKLHQEHPFRFYTLATKNDELVQPLASALVSENQFTVEGIGHAALLYSPQVAGKLVEWLTD